MSGHACPYCPAAAPAGAASSRRIDASKDAMAPLKAAFLHTVPRCYQQSSPSSEMKILWMIVLNCAGIFCSNSQKKATGTMLSSRSSTQQVLQNRETPCPAASHAVHVEQTQQVSGHSHAAKLHDQMILFQKEMHTWRCDSPSQVCSPIVRE